MAPLPIQGTFKFEGVPHTSSLTCLLRAFVYSVVSILLTST